MGQNIMLFTSLINYAFRSGALRVIDHKGGVKLYGDGSPPRCTIRLTKASLEYKLAVKPGLSVPEAYMNGDLLIEDGTLYDFIELAAQNYSSVEAYPLLKIMRMIGLGSKKIRQYNPIRFL